MALPILDGNQTAATLSTVLTSGEHIPAHTVVSLGSQAITDIRSAVSGSVVSISNFPASQGTTFGAVTGSVSVLNLPSTQTIAGTVTANGLALGQEIANVFPLGIGQIGGGGVRAVADLAGYYVPVAVREGTVTANLSAQFQDEETNLYAVRSATAYDDDGDLKEVSNNYPLPVKVQQLPEVSGTVTANAGDVANLVGGGYANLVDLFANELIQIGSLPDGVAFGQQLADGFDGYGGAPVQITASNTTLPISGTVTANVLAVDQFALQSALEQYAANYSDGWPVKPSDGNSFPISGTVTVGAVSTSVTVAQIQGTSVTTSNFTSTTASQTLVSANSSRRGLTVFNEGAGNLHICAGATATTVAYQVRLSAGDYWECPAVQTSLTHSAQFASAGTARIVEIL